MALSCHAAWGSAGRADPDPGHGSRVRGRSAVNEFIAAFGHCHRHQLCPSVLSFISLFVPITLAWLEVAAQL